jgi:hypothetical protein
MKAQPVVKLIVHVAQKVVYALGRNGRKKIYVDVLAAF